MKSRLLSHLWAIFIPLLLTTSSSYAITVYVINASYQGWYDSIGNARSGGDYIAGDSTGLVYRDYFVFNLNGLPAGAVATAYLSLYNPGASVPGDIDNGFLSPNASETYQVGSVGTPISSLIQGTGGVATFNNLAAGTSFGTQLVSSADDGAYVTVSLNSSFRTDASSQLGSGEIAVGGFLAGDTGFTQNDYIFGFSGAVNSPVPQLSLIIVPEPSITAMGVLSAVLLVVGHAARAKPRFGLPR